MKKKVFTSIILLMLAAIAYDDALNQIEDIQNEFKAAFDTALEDRTSGYKASAKIRVLAAKTKLWDAIHEEVEVELSILGLKVPWTMLLPNLSAGVTCVCETARGYDKHPLLSAMPDILAGAGDAALFDQFTHLLVDRGLATLIDIGCPSCSGFTALDTELGCQRLNVRGAALELVTTTLRELERAANSTSKVKRDLQIEFNGRIALLPPEIQSRARALLDSPNAISQEVVTKTTRTTLGTVVHQVSEPTANIQYVEDEIAILTSSVRLPQLTQPWRQRYPTRNNCVNNRWRCSRIEIRVPQGQDYLIVIKDRNERTVNHGYVRAGTTGSFEVNNGSYTTYFITGIGWNAAKPVPCVSCGALFGYFNSSVSVTKSDLEYLTNNVLSFSMATMINGNFRPTESNLEEAL